MRLGFIGTGEITKATVIGILKSNIKLNKISISKRNIKISKFLTIKFEIWQKIYDHSRLLNSKEKSWKRILVIWWHSDSKVARDA